MWDKKTKIISYVATMKCNMNCEYCTLVGDKRHNNVDSIDIGSFMSTLNKLDEKIALIFQGGEIFLVPNFIELVDVLASKGYKVLILSNLTHGNVKNIIKVSNIENVAISCSIHYREYEKTNAKKLFLENYTFLKSHNFNVWPKLLADAKMTNEDMDNFTEVYVNQHNVELSLTHPLITEHLESYTSEYTKEQNDFFWESDEEKESASVFVKTHHQKGKPCQAGKNCAMINEFGEVGPCTLLTITDKLDDKYKMGTIKDGFSFNKDDLICPLDTCTCHVDTMWGPDE